MSRQGEEEKLADDSGDSGMLVRGWFDAGGHFYAEQRLCERAGMRRADIQVYPSDAPEPGERRMLSMGAVITARRCYMSYCGSWYVATDSGTGPGACRLSVWRTLSPPVGTPPQDPEATP